MRSKRKREERLPGRLPDRPRATAPRVSVFYVAGSAVVSVGVLAYLFTIVRPREIVEAIRNAALAGLAAYMAANLLTSVLRNWRYIILLRATDTTVRIGSVQMFLVTLVRNLFSDLLPARVGTLIYIYILKARFGFPVEIGASTYSVSLMLDLVVMVPLMCMGIIAIGVDQLGISPAALFWIASFFLAITVLVLAYLAPILRCAGGLLEMLAGRRPRVERIREKLDLTSREVSRICRTKAFWKAAALSVLIRTLKYGCIAFLVFAVLSPIDAEKYALRKIGYWPVFVGASLAELSASTPVSGIGGFGAYEGVWKSAFQLLGYPPKLAALSGISAHVITQAFGYTLGIAALLVLAAPLVKRKLRGAGGGRDRGG